MFRSNSAFRRLARYVRPYNLWVFITVITSLCLAAIDIVLGKAIEQMAQGTFSSTQNMIYLVVGMTLIGMPCKFVMRYASARFSVSALRDLRGDLIHKFCDLPVSSVERKFTGDLIAILSQIGTDPDLLLSEIQLNTDEQPEGFLPDSIDFVF